VRLNGCSAPSRTDLAVGVDAKLVTEARIIHPAGNNRRTKLAAYRRLQCKCWPNSIRTPIKQRATTGTRVNEDRRIGAGSDDRQCPGSAARKRGRIRLLWDSTAEAITESVATLGTFAIPHAPDARFQTPDALARGYTISSTIRMLTDPYAERIALFRPRSKKAKAFTQTKKFLARMHQFPAEYWPIQPQEGEWSVRS